MSGTVIEVTDLRKRYGDIDAVAGVDLGIVGRPELLFLDEPTTVKTHLMRAYEKPGLGDRTSAVSRAIRRGLLPEK